jgi:hypothetical protein
MFKFYTGIGGRNTPKEICKQFTIIAGQLETLGFILRSGGAEGADTAFELGVKEDKNKNIYLPWKGFNGNDSELFLSGIKEFPITEFEINLTKEIYTRFDFVSEPTQLMHIRNLYQVFGTQVKEILYPEFGVVDPHMAKAFTSQFIIAWTDRPENDTGGTQFGLHVAKKYDIPTYNFYYREQENKFYDFLNTLIKGVQQNG